MTSEEILEDKVQRRIDAYFPPLVPSLAVKVFDFFREVDHYTVNAGGMEHYVIRLDEHKISKLAKKRGIDLYRYMPLFKLYETKILLQQQERRSQND